MEGTIGSRVCVTYAEPANPVADPRGVYTVGLGTGFSTTEHYSLLSSRLSRRGTRERVELARTRARYRLPVASVAQNHQNSSSSLPVRIIRRRRRRRRGSPRLTINLKQWRFFSGRAVAFRPTRLSLSLSPIFRLFLFPPVPPSYSPCFSPLTRFRWMLSVCSFEGKAFPVRGGGDDL